MNGLTRSRKKACKNGLGGIDRLWIMNYVKYSPRLMKGYRDLELTSFPATVIYEWFGELDSSEQMNETGAFTQEINIRIAKKEIFVLRGAEVLMNSKVRIIARHRRGGLKIYGLQSGLDAEVKSFSGGTAFDFNGYDIKFEGLEELESPFIYDLEEVGFFDNDSLIAECLLSSTASGSSSGINVSDCNNVDTGKIVDINRFLSSTALLSSSGYLTSKTFV